MGQHDKAFARARIRRREVAAGDVEKLREIAPDPALLDEEADQLFVWDVTASNNRLDWYYTRMSARTLENYAEDARAGVAFLDSHNSQRLPLGRSFDAMLRRAEGANPDFEGEDLIEAVMRFYTLDNHNPGGGSITTSDFVRGLRAGLIFDVSVGFWGTQRCALCGQNYWSWDCPHIGGLEYDSLNEEGEVIGRELAWSWIDDGHVAEVSAVYDGATPGAIIEKAEREIAEGRLAPDAIRALEQRYRVDLPDLHIRSGWTRNEGGVIVPTDGTKGKRSAADEVVVSAALEDMPDELGTAEAAGAVEANTEDATGADAIAELAEVEAEMEELPEDAGETAAERVAWLVSRVAELEPLAEIGADYRRSLEDEAWKARIRAGGKSDEQAYRSKLRHYSVDDLRQEIADLEVIGSGRLKGGRQSRDTDDRQGDEVANDRRRHAPAHVYGG